MTGKIKRRAEEGILVTLILLQVLDFLEVLPGDIDYVKKIISWSALGYLLYKADLTGVMFGHSKKADAISLLIIASYFLLITKNLTGYAMVAEEARLFEPFLSTIANNAFYVELISFYLGGIMLLIISAYLTLTYRIHKPSLMHIIHEEGPPPKTTSKFLVRLFSNFMVLIAFFIIIFNLMMEWLAMAVDSTLAIFAILFYLFVIIRHHKKLGADTLIYKVGEVGEGFYEKFIRLFQSKKGLSLGVAGLLVLHLLTDIANFIIPYIVSRKDALYFRSLSPETHQSIASLFISDFSVTSGIIAKVALAWTYVFNIVAILFLLFLPAYIWYKLYKKRGFTVSPLALSIFFASVTVLIISPVIGMSPIYEQGMKDSLIVGVDFTTNQISGEPIISFVASAVVGLLVFLTSLKHGARKILVALAIITVDVFVAIYVSFFVKSLWRYYTDMIVTLLGSPHVFIGSYILIFFALTILFYIIGFLVFILETKEEFNIIRF